MKLLSRICVLAGSLLLAWPCQWAQAQTRSTVPSWLLKSSTKTTSSGSSSGTTTTSDKENITSTDVFLLQRGVTTPVDLSGDKTADFIVLPNGQVAPVEDHKGLEPGQDIEDLEYQLLVTEAKRDFSGNGTLVSFRATPWNNLEDERQFAPKDNSLLALSLGPASVLHCEKSQPLSLKFRAENLNSGGKAPLYSLAAQGCLLNFNQITVLAMHRHYAQALQFCQSADPACDFIWVDIGRDGRLGNEGGGYLDDSYIAAKIKSTVPQALQNTQLNAVATQTLANLAGDQQSASPGDGLQTCTSSTSGAGKRVYVNDTSIERLASMYCHTFASERRYGSESCEAALTSCTTLTKAPLMEEFRQATGPAGSYGCVIQHGGSATHPIEDLVCCPDAIYNTIVYRIFYSAFIPSLSSLKEVIDQECR